MEEITRKKRIRDYGIVPGRLQTGAGNRITDVDGVRVGHCTIHQGQNHTGVTVILPGEENPFLNPCVAAAYVHNGFGKSAGLVQIQELGTLETPIALTNTLSVGSVWDALTGYMIERCEQDGVTLTSVNPVVGECNDSRINRIQNRVVEEKHVRSAIASASKIFEEGAVGAGTGTICHGLKGGIGTASRVIRIGNREYTIGALVQSNYGATEDFTLFGKPFGQQILAWKQEKDDMAASEQDRGSIMTVLATDLPLSSRQLYRVIRRAGVGISRTGAYMGHGSGEVMIGFTTANRLPRRGGEEPLCLQILPEEQLNKAFLAAAEAVWEAILNSMVCAERARGLEGELYYSLAEILPKLWENEGVRN